MIETDFVKALDFEELRNLKQEINKQIRIQKQERKVVDYIN